MVLARLDHCSSWAEAAQELRAYVAAGEPDAEIYAAVADAIERELAVADPDAAPAVLGFYGGAVLMLASLEHLRRYGEPDDHRAQVEMVRRLAEDV